MASPIQGILTWFSKMTKAHGRELGLAVLAALHEDADTDKAVKASWEALGLSSIFADEVKQCMKVSFEKNGRKAPKLLPALTGAWDESGMTLSQKLHGASREMRQKIVNTIRAQQKLNAHAMTAARALYDGYGYGHVTNQQGIPQYLQKVVDFARRSDMTALDEQALLAKVRKAQRLVDKLGQNGAPNIALRSAYTELLDAVSKDSEKALERAVKTACEEKSRYVAERIARTESARAWANGFVERYGADESVVAYQWKLASRHPEFDICNLYAEANLWGLGDGIFPKDKTPSLPAHPHCLCHLAPVYRSELAGKKAKDQTDAAGRAWIENLPEKSQKALLGVHGREAFTKGAEWKTVAKNFVKKFLPSKVSKSLLESGIIKEEAVVFTPEMLGSAFTSEKEISSTRVIVDTLNAVEGKDPDVLLLYSKLAELEKKKPFSIEHHVEKGYEQGYCSLDGKTVCLPKTKKASAVGQTHTVVHEFGHWFDVFFKGYYQNVKFLTAGDKGLHKACLKYLIKSPDDIPSELKAISKEMREYERKIREDAYEELRQERLRISREKGYDYARKWYFAQSKKVKVKVDNQKRSWRNGMAGLEDIIDALSGGRARDEWSAVSYGHGTKYYQRGFDYAATEIFANYCALSMMNPEAVKLLKKFFPELDEALHQIVVGMNAVIQRGYY